MHGSCSAEAARHELDFVFEQPRTQPAVFDNCAVCLVKPHCVAARETGKVLDALLRAGLEVSGLRTLSLTRRDAADLLEAYRGVVPEFSGWLQELTDSVAVVIEVRGENVVARLRELAGPYPSEVARIVSPESLRARFGRDTVHNAVHVTDLADDGPLESKFLFTVVA